MSVNFIRKRTVCDMVIDDPGYLWGMAKNVYFPISKRLQGSLPDVQAFVPKQLHKQPCCSQCTERS